METASFMDSMIFPFCIMLSSLGWLVRTADGAK